MADFKDNGPGGCCCGACAGRACFTVRGCNQNLVGYTVQMVRQSDGVVVGTTTSGGTEVCMTVPGPGTYNLVSSPTNYNQGFVQVSCSSTDTHSVVLVAPTATTRTCCADENVPMPIGVCRCHYGGGADDTINDPQSAAVGATNPGCDWAFTRSFQYAPRLTYWGSGLFRVVHDQDPTGCTYIGFVAGTLVPLDVTVNASDLAPTNPAFCPASPFLTGPWHYYG